MTRLARFPLAASALALLFACHGDRAVMPPLGVPSAAISDGAHGETHKHFFFLPPMVPDPSHLFTPDAFNQHLRPVVEICEWDGSACVLPLLARFTMTDGPGSETVRLSIEDKHYIVNWHTNESGLSTGKTYRIRVFGSAGGLGSTALGFADVELSDTPGKMKKTQATQSDEETTVDLVDGRTLPIKFRIESGAYCKDTSDCVEAVVDNSGGTVTTSTGFAGARFPENWLPLGFDEVVVIIERVRVSAKEPCLPTDLQQFEGCYRYETDPPNIGNFRETVIVGQCIEPAAADREDIQLHQFDPDDPEAGVRPLKSVAASFIDEANCQGNFTPSSFAAGPFGSLFQYAGSGWRAVRKLVWVKPLFAANEGLGGETGSWSNIGWARNATLQVLSAADQTAIVGTEVSSAPIVKVVTTHPAEAPVGGAQVLFTIVGGGGNVAGLDAAFVTTGGDGLASVPWTTGAKLTEAENRIMVSTPFVDNSPLFFTAAPLIRQNDPTIGCPEDPASGHGFQIVFDWNDVPGATGYQIVVALEGAAQPAVDESVDDSEFTHTACNTFVIDENLEGWRWRFRAQEGGETFGEWSVWFSFAFAPCRLAGDTPCFAPAPSLAWSVLSTGEAHSCGVTTAGAVYCWGRNEFGQRGDGTTTSSMTPVAVSSDLEFASVSAGLLHTCGVTTAGAAYCWGFNSSGQLGDGTTTSSSSPVAVSPELGLVFASVSTGQHHTCGVTSGGVAYCWGLNNNGQLGDGGVTTQHVPVAVSGEHVFASVTTGAVHTCGVTIDNGAAYCWGRGEFGRLGDGTATTQLRPVAVSGEHQFASVSGGEAHSCGVTTSEVVYCWGDNTFGQVGDGTTINRLDPVAVSLELGPLFTALSARGIHTCGVATSGAAYCWGSNGQGRLGDGTTTDQHQPVAVSGELELLFTSVSAGGSHTCGVTTTGAAYCWGSNADGRLGDGTTTTRLTPVRVSEPAVPIS